MPASDLRGAAAAVGVGLAGHLGGGGRTHLELIAEATRLALDDAGLKLSDVDGLFTANLVNFMPLLSVAEYLGISPRWMDGSQIGGSSFVHYAMSAAVALKLGLCDVALIVYGSDAASNKPTPLSAHEFLNYEAEYNSVFPASGVALAAKRHMELYGTTRAQMASVAVAARQWAMLNPQAAIRTPLTVEDVLQAPKYIDPFTTLDCGAMTDGAAALVMVSSERARDLRNKPVYFLGGGTALSHRRLAQARDITTTAAVESGERAFAMANVSRSDVNLLQLYDGFTIYPILFLEDLGFCDKGEGGPFVEGGAIAPGGALPVNTNGGSLSSVHPGMYGLFLLVEAVHQLRRSAGARQVEKADLALCHGNGGHLSSQSTVIWGSPDTI